MRNKKCIDNMIYHFEQEIGCCEYCDEKATHLTFFGSYFRRGWRFLCKKHFHEWMKGELYL